MLDGLKKIFRFFGWGQDDSLQQKRSAEYNDDDSELPTKRRKMSNKVDQFSVIHSTSFDNPYSTFGRPGKENRFSTKGMRKTGFLYNQSSGEVKSVNKENSSASTPTPQHVTAGPSKVPLIELHDDDQSVEVVAETKRPTLYERPEWFSAPRASNHNGARRKVTTYSNTDSEVQCLETPSNRSYGLRYSSDPHLRSTLSDPSQSVRHSFPRNMLKLKLTSRNNNAIDHDARMKEKMQFQELISKSRRGYCAASLVGRHFSSTNLKHSTKADVLRNIPVLTLDGDASTSRGPIVVNNTAVKPSTLATKIADDSVKLPAGNGLESIFFESRYYKHKTLVHTRQKYDEKKRATEDLVKEQSMCVDSYRKQNSDSITVLEERLRRHLAVTEVVLLEPVEEPALPELTSAIEAKIRAALVPYPKNETLVEKFGLRITRHDIQTLSGLQWLNDEVINFYMNLLIERGKSEKFPNVYAFNTFFYPKLLSGGQKGLQRWTRKIDIFAQDIIIVPVHLNVHWCLAAIDFRDKHIRYYDSMGNANNRCLRALLEYLCDESKDKKKCAYDTSNWKILNVTDIPQQMNGSDCGMFSCMYAEYICRDAKISFTQTEMPYFRKKMVYEILSGNLMTFQ